MIGRWRHDDSAGCHRNAVVDWHALLRDQRHDDDFQENKGEGQAEYRESGLLHGQSISQQKQRYTIFFSLEKPTGDDEPLELVCTASYQEKRRIPVQTLNREVFGYPLPPMTRIASSVTSAAVSVANSLAIPASRSQRSPRSFFAAAE